MTQLLFFVDVPGARIINGSKWANNAAAENVAKVSATKIVFDQSTIQRDTDRWIITNYQGGYRIFNMGSNNWASISGKQVVGVPNFNPETCKWSIEYSGEGLDFWIRVPHGGPAWTIRPGSVQGQTTVFLDPLNDRSAKQRVTFIVPE